MPWEPNKRVVCMRNRAPQAIAQNPDLWEYRLLTYAFFYPYSGSYDFTAIDQQIFRNSFIDDEAVCYARDTNHPQFQLDRVADLEELNVFNRESESYMDDTQQYINVLDMIKSIGLDAYIYGLWLGIAENERLYNIGRYTYRMNPSLYADYASQLENTKQQLKHYRTEERKLIMGRLNILRDRFAASASAMILSCYQYYSFSDVTSPAMYYWTYMVRRKIQNFRYVFGPDMPLYVFLQPVFTDSFTAFPAGVWDQMLYEMDNNPDVDRIYIFARSTEEPGPDWQQPLIDGPVQQIVVP
jgi:hypothetical protein